MHRLHVVLTLCLAAALLAPASLAQERSTPTLGAEAAEARPTGHPATERPVYYRYDEATGRLVLNEAGRAASAAFRADLPKTTRRAPAARPAPLTDAERQVLAKEQARALSADPARVQRLQQRMADAVAQNPRAEVASFSGNTTGESTWQRPANVGDGTSGSCFLSPSGSAVPYEANSLTVPATASYDVYASYDFFASDYDGYLTLYEGSFDPSDPCLNLIALSDDFVDLSQSLIESVALTAGTTYLAVVTGFDNGDFGVYKGGVYDAGTAPLTFTVTTAFDSEEANPGDRLCFENDFGLFECTLRAAIEEANATEAVRPVFIDFAIDNGPTGAEIAPGVWRIQVDFVPPTLSGGGPVPLPFINKSDVTIDGLTQPGASCGDLVNGPKHDLRVVLDGSPLAFGEGIFGQGGGLTVRGLVVQNFPGFGLELRNVGDNLAECNYLGTDYTGETAAGNFSGVFISGTAQNNVVSGNADIGILPDPFEDGMVVQRNLVGSDADGNQPLGNGATGIWVSGDNAVINTNLASANGFQGIFLTLDPGQHGALPSGVVLTNNTVGLTKNRNVGPGGMGNGNDGILVFDDGDNFEDLEGNDIGLPGAGNGNFVGNNGQYGILFFGSGVLDNRIRGNTIGLTLNGSAAPNGYGVYVAEFGAGAPSGTQIGGLAAGEGNIISGNALSGVFLAAGFDMRVEGNTIGLNASGAARPNGQVGDGLDNSGIDVVLGSNLFIEGNTVSGNNGSGIRFFSPTSVTGEDDARGEEARAGFDIFVTDNRIGTNAAGTAARPNIESGLVLGNSALFATVTGNTISGNTDTGVFLSGGVSGVTLENNFIGTNSAGASLGNGAPGGDGRAGIFCQNASDVRIGQNFQPNTIRFNGRDGIFLSAGCADISVVGNIIYSNGELAVDLAPNGPNPNDAGDGDAGANDKLNFPVIVSAENDGANSIISWTLNAEANTTYELLFCRNQAPDPSGFGECRTPNALTTATTDGSGNASGTQTLGVAAYPAGTFVTANATEVDGPLPAGYRKTSEFGASIEVDDTSAPGAVTIDATPTSPLTVPRGGQVSFTYTVANGTNSPATGQSWFSAAIQNGPTLAEGVITSGTLPAGQQVTINYTQNVPNNAPIANYDFCLRIGLFPSPFIDEECFVVTVTPARVAGGGDEWAAVDVSPWAPAPMDSGTETEGAEAASSAALPETVELSGAYPNPFSGRATVSLAVPEAQRVTLAVYDVLGRAVAVLVDGEVAAGRHEAVLDGTTLPSGVYLVRLAAGGVVQTQRITLVR